MGTDPRSLRGIIRLAFPGDVTPPLRIFDLGYQYISSPSEKDFGALADLVDPDHQQSFETLLSWGRRSQLGPPVTTAEVLTALGARYDCIDLTPQATVQADLNYATCPDRLRGTCDLVTNFGTTEHIFNQWACFTLMHDACRVGGALAHVVPMNGYALHCLFKYDAKFFDLLASANNYEVLHFGFGRLERGEHLDGRFSTWHNFEAVADERFDGHVVEAVLRKTTDQPFRPPMDLHANSSPVSTRFPSPRPSLRD